MKIIQSFWTKPFAQSYTGDRDNRPDGGWLNQSYYFMSWVFSFWQLSKKYPVIELVTDRKGKELLVDLLELPYSKVHVKLDDLNEYPAELWALGKMYSYALQEEPFLHVDSDFFIWDRFPESAEQSPLVAQHKEFGYQFYQELFTNVKNNFEYIPSSITRYASFYKIVNAYNLGVTGGTDVSFFKEFSKQAFYFIDINIDKLHKIQAGLFNTFYEQVLFCSVAHEKNINVFTLLNSEDECITVWEAQGLDRFVRAPRKAYFIHLYGYCKRDQRYCYVLENKVKKEYPRQHARIKKIFDERKVSTALYPKFS